MYLDSGVATIYSLENVAQKPLMPAEKLVYVTEGYYGIRTIGVSRYYQAAGADRQIDALIRMQWDAAIKAGLYAVLEDGEQYRVDRVQRVDDENDLRMLDLTLVRLEDRYDVAG